MSKTIKIINDELIEIASYRNPEIVFHDSNNPRHLKPEYDNFESYCDFKEVINPFELYAENQQLKKQKDDVVIKYIKYLIKRLEEFDILERKETGAFWYQVMGELKKLLRMLGEIDNE